MSESSTPAPVPGIVAYVASRELMQASARLPSNPHRATLVHGLARALGLFEPHPRPRRHLTLLAPPPASTAQLGAYHSAEYLAFVLDGEGDGAEFGLVDDCHPFPGMDDYVRRVGGASLAAAQVVLRGTGSPASSSLTSAPAPQTDITASTTPPPPAPIAIAWDGGRHHATRSHAAGFCYVGDCVLAILALRRARRRVVYLDLDVHFGDGVAGAFRGGRGRGCWQTLSIHHAAPGFFPASPFAELPTPDSDPFSLSLPLMAGASNGTYARAWGAVERCGVDGLAGDACGVGNWGLGPVGEAGTLGWCVQRVLEWGWGRCCWGRGYNSPNAARAWAYLTSIALGDPLDLSMPIPDHAQFPLYGPSFTLDVAVGTMQDTNTEAHMAAVEVAFEAAAQKIRPPATSM
ncbi:hypothetical protein B0H10DRAFT_2343839 [Mycena sp. CBHHK59/15]|nr:hypothetical protein B0H10DRAFT_2343839 [Mycena sp. CBHHK59/15]